jgi:putative transposase
MPWEETTRMSQRGRFVVDFDSCLYTMTELCERYGISRKTGYKWAERYSAEGFEGLVDRDGLL